jgi:hypothetical protein
MVSFKRCTQRVSSVQVQYIDVFPNQHNLHRLKNVKGIYTDRVRSQ